MIRMFSLLALSTALAAPALACDCGDHDAETAAAPATAAEVQLASATQPMGEADGVIAASNAWVRAPIGGRDVTAGYMRLVALEDDAIIAAGSPSVERIELHTHINDGGVMRMRPVEQIDLPAGEAVSLEPGGLHLMLFGLDPAALEAGAMEVTLVFAEAEPMTLTLPIQDGPGHQH